MAIQIDQIHCTGCGCCMDACDFGAIEFNVDPTTSWEKAYANEDHCTDCETCVAMCPSGAIDQAKQAV